LVISPLKYSRASKQQMGGQMKIARALLLLGFPDPRIEAPLARH